MPSLLDIAPPEVTTEEVDIRGTRLTLRALTAKETAALMKRFPVLAKQAAQAEVDAGEALISSIEMAPAIIAAALGNSGDAEIEALVEARLTIDERKMVMDAVMRLQGGQPARPLPADPAPAASAGKVLDGSSPPA